MDDLISKKTLKYMSEWVKRGNKPRLKKRIPKEIFDKDMTLCACVRGLGPCNSSILNDSGVIIGNLTK